MNGNKASPVHPGEVLLENFLEPLGISQDRVAKELNVPPRRIYEIVQGQRSINSDIAHRLAHYFGMSERFWLDLQARYDLGGVEKQQVHRRTNVAAEFRLKCLNHAGRSETF
jgi:addiction module HigA family antidote